MYEISRQVLIQKFEITINKIIIKTIIFNNIIAYGANGEPVGATTTTTEQNENNTSTANTNQIQKLNATKDDEISKIEVNSPRIPIKNPTVVRFDLENNDSSNSVNNKTEVGQKGYLGPIRSTVCIRISDIWNRPKNQFFWTDLVVEWVPIF